MATESELIGLLDSIADRAPSTWNILDRMALQTVPSQRSSRRWLPVVATVAGVAASVVVVVAVGGTGPRHVSATARSSAPKPVVDSATYPLPLDAYYASAAQMLTLQRAQFVLAQRCAQAHGVSVPTAHFPAADPRPTFLAQVANNIRPLTLQQAQTIGYDLYPSEAPSGESAVQTAVAGLTPQQLEIFQGWTSGTKPNPPINQFLFDGGCVGQATRTLLRGAKPVPTPGRTELPAGEPELFDDDVTVQNLYLNAADSGNSTPPVQQAQQRWSACMAAHDYPGLHTTESTIVGLHNLTSASAKREAVQDVKCKESTGFMAVWIASMTQAQNAVIAAHQSELAGFQQRLATRMANAAAALR